MFFFFKGGCGSMYEVYVEAPEFKVTHSDIGADF